MHPTILGVLAWAASQGALAAPTPAVPPLTATATAAVATATAPIPEPFEDADDVPMPDPDLWHRIRVGFLLEPLDSPLVADQETWYASRPDYIKRFVDRGSRYLHY